MNVSEIFSALPSQSEPSSSSTPKQLLMKLTIICTTRVFPLRPSTRIALNANARMLCELFVIHLNLLTAISEAFRTGKSPLLVTTGVTARGLDVYDVGHVINYDLPKINHGGIDEYIHRIGRTARIGHVGVATSLYNEQDEGLGDDLTKLLMETGMEVPDFLQGFKPEGREGASVSEEQAAEASGEAGQETSAGGGWNTEENVNSGW